MIMCLHCGFKGSTNESGMITIWEHNKRHMICRKCGKHKNQVLCPTVPSHLDVMIIGDCGDDWTGDPIGFEYKGAL